jgi:hypothetical protein
MAKDLMRRGKRWRGLKSLLLILPVAAILLSRPFPKTIFSLSETEIFTLNQNRALYPHPWLGRLLENKLWAYWAKYKENFFQGFDPNYYFFANHPRERAGVREKEIFPWLLLPIFIAGLILQIKKGHHFGWQYFLAVLFPLSFLENPDPFIYWLYPFFAYAFLGIIWIKELKP